VERNFRIAISIGAVAVAFSWLAGTLVLSPRPRPSTAIVVAPTGHAYRYVAAPNISWGAARDAAAHMTWQGHPGYLATIDDAAEFRFVIDRVFTHAFPDVTYLGGRQASPGAWRWVTGPDGAADGGAGTLFWKGEKYGTVSPGRYANWMVTAFQKGGAWDVSKVCCVTLFSYGIPQFSTSLGTGYHKESVAGYLVEFGD